MMHSLQRIGIRITVSDLMFCMRGSSVDEDEFIFFLCSVGTLEE